MNLAPFRGLRIRPTSERVREAIFNLLGQDMEGYSVLDLFAGTGVLGIEAMSRGAEKAVFIDNSIESIKIIQKNLNLFNFTEAATIIKRDLKRGLPEINKWFHLVFIDPPYEKGLIRRVFDDLIHGPYLMPEAFVVIESRKGEILPDETHILRKWKQRIYGDTIITIYHKEN